MMRQCRQCGQHTLPSVSRAAFCPRCRYIRREQSRRTPRLSLGPLPSHAPHREATDHVERLFQAARAARLAREQATGQRTYTIESGWVQRPGASDWMDADGQSTGWRR
jgi:hypothetical protein